MTSSSNIAYHEQEMFSFKMCNVQKDDILRHFRVVNWDKYFSVLEAATYDNNKFVHDDTGHLQSIQNFSVSEGFGLSFSVSN